ncbi:MAG: hypothetical protein JW836_08420 [Deltaproteobacteria bacterium]|nr:hypothetical protein [Deltaproteobacteria bacterium]
MNTIRFLFLIVFPAFFFTGCGTYAPPPATEAPLVFPLESLAVFGFLSSPLPTGEKDGTVRSSLTGSIFVRGSVPSEIPEQLTARLYERLSMRLSLELISPDIARQAFSTVKDSSYDFDDKEIVRKTGESVPAAAVLAGRVFRWQERIGADFSISRPASVAFELALINVADGNVIWKGKFDKTQASLAEDLLDLNTFLKGKGRWMSVEDLAEIGLSELVERLPLAKKE